MVSRQTNQRLHTVHKGETLWSIAQAYNTTVDALRSANPSLHSRDPQVGEQIVVH